MLLLKPVKELFCSPLISSLHQEFIKEDHLPIFNCKSDRMIPRMIYCCASGVSVVVLLA